MAETPSTMIPLGPPMPGFSLQDAVSGRVVSDAEFEAAREVARAVATQRLGIVGSGTGAAPAVKNRRRRQCASGI